MVYSTEKHIPTDRLCRWLGLPRSVYYYQPGKGKPGAKPSTHTLKLTGELVENEMVVQQIIEILGRPFASWGYEITAAILKRTFVINEKKVYRLMDEHNLLLNRVSMSSGARQFVQFRTVEAKYPMEYLSMDIKYVWVAGEKRNYYLLTIIDIFSKRVLNHILRRSIRKRDVVDFLKTLNDRHQIKGVRIRNDNGPQFIAGLVKNFLRVAEVEQQFSHPGTPEENCYIEAWHSILQTDVIDRFEFESFYEARLIIDQFIEEYNTYRPHRSIGMKTPMEMWRTGLIVLEKQRQTGCGENESLVVSQSVLSIDQTAYEQFGNRTTLCPN